MINIPFVLYVIIISSCYCPFTYCFLFQLSIGMSDIIIGQPNFPKELLGIIRDFFRNGTFTDLTIISQDGVHFLVHRAVVSASSAHLCAAHHMGGGTHLTGNRMYNISYE